MKLQKSLATTFLSATLAFSIGISTWTATSKANATANFKYGRSQQTSENTNFRSNSGALNILDDRGQTKSVCPLQNTSVQADIAGYVARVNVEQVFTNPTNETIEATYIFPLSNTSAVDEMTMKIGDRTIKGEIKTRAQAAQIYAAAKSQGKTAALLDQERPNIFTQSVANIPPHATIRINIKYVEYLPYQNGEYSFVFPMVVGPRFMGGTPDPERISPPMAGERTRAGHDISLKVNINSGFDISNINSKLHKIEVKHASKTTQVSLAKFDSIPNRDFVLNWKAAGDDIKSGFLAHKDGDVGFFNIMFLPPQAVQRSEVAPRELVFLVDKSGSQHGLPMQKCRETMVYILDRLNPQDTFQLIAFDNTTDKLFSKPMPASQENILEAKKWVSALEANGGTNLKAAVDEVCRQAAPQNRLRICALLTDGYIGNDREVIGDVVKYRGVSRWFTFGTGNSVNRHLLDGVAKAGGGESEFVLLNTHGDKVAKDFYEKLASPVLTDIKVEFDGVQVKDVQPSVINDIWAKRPLYLTGKYLKAGAGFVRIRGLRGGKAYEQKLPIRLPEKELENKVLSSVWARMKVDELTQALNLVSRLDSKKEMEQSIESVGLDYHIMTQFTSFVAVDESGQTHKPSDKKIAVVTETPQGVSLKKISPIFPRQLPEEIGRVEGPRDMNMFQVEPTVWDERHYTSGRAERHQKTSPTLPEGAPIPDTDSTPAEKISEEVKNKMASMKDQSESLKLKLTVQTCSDSFVKLLKQLKGIEVIKVDSETKSIIIKLPAKMINTLSQYAGVLKISLENSP
ncbi:MAG: VIT and VWA domain-containing protein [Candidatus Melainabacteria bacterium]|nr:VIT and VWA domain-containing protein [Candidatus Melainabacteria bacterium]